MLQLTSCAVIWTSLASPLVLSIWLQVTNVTSLLSLRAVRVCLALADIKKMRKDNYLIPENHGFFLLLLVLNEKQLKIAVGNKRLLSPDTITYFFNSDSAQEPATRRLIFGDFPPHLIPFDVG